MRLKNLAAPIILLVVMIFLPAFVPPIGDGGGFPPTNTPTNTPEPTETQAQEATQTETPTPTEELDILAVTFELPNLTETLAVLEGAQGSNIVEPTQAPVSGGGSPLILIAYMGLFIALAIGLWLLFGRRRPSQNP